MLLEEFQCKIDGGQNLDGVVVGKSKEILLGIDSNFRIDGDVNIIQPEFIFDQFVCQMEEDFLDSIDSKDVENCNDEEVGFDPDVMGNFAKTTLGQLADQFENW